MVNKPQGKPSQRVTIEKFGGMNTNTSLKSIGDNEFGLLVNAMPMADGKISTIAENTNNATITPTSAIRMTNLILNGAINTFIFDGTTLWIETANGGEVQV